MFAPADEPTSDTDGIHIFAPIPADAYVLQIAYIGYHVQTVPHEARSGFSDTLTVTLLSGALCLHH